MLHFYDLGSLTSFVCLVPMMSAHLSFEWHIEHVQLVVCMFNFVEVWSYIDLLWDIDAVEVEVRFRTQVFAQFQGTHLSIHSLWSSFLSFIAILCLREYYLWIVLLFLFHFMILFSDSLSLTTKPELSHTILVLYLRRNSGLYRRINACLSYIFMRTWCIMSIDFL